MLDHCVDSLVSSVLLELYLIEKSSAISDVCFYFEIIPFIYHLLFLMIIYLFTYNYTEILNNALIVYMLLAISASKLYIKTLHFIWF